MNRPKLRASLVLTLMLSLLFLYFGSKFTAYTPTEAGFDAMETATVTAVTNTITNKSESGYIITTVLFDARLTSGARKGEVVEMEQIIDEMILPVPKAVDVGDSLLAIEAMGTSADWVWASINHSSTLTTLLTLFLLLIIVIGGWKGGTTILSLVVTIAAIFMVYIPAILSGRNIYISTIVVATFIILSSLLILNGCNKKTLCAVVGNVGGTLMAGLFALIANRAFHITGVVDPDYAFLLMLGGDTPLNLTAVVWGGILIGSLGAIMDVAMTIASSMQELAQEMEVKTMGGLIRSGLAIGRDAIGTMTNTLILAYVGGSLATVLLFTAYNRNPLYILNLEMILVEIIQAIVGSMGILIAVPLTVFFAAWVHTKNK